MFCTKFKGQIKKMLQEFDSYVDDHIDIALKITTELKQVLVSPVADIVLAIIPGDIDKAIRAQLINALNKVLEALTIASNCRQYTDVNEKLKCFTDQLRQHDPHLQDAILQKMASLLAGHIDGQRMRQSLYDLYTQAKYSASKNQ